MTVNKLESLLVIPLLIISVLGQQDSSYGVPGFSSTGSDFSGPSAPSGQGRIVGNSILDFEQGPTGNSNGQRFQSQLGFSPTRPITTGPGVVGNQRGGVPSNNRNVSPSNAAPTFNRNSQGQKVFRYVSVHVAPPESPVSRPRPTQPPQRPETHYQIVFIKAPSPVTQDLQEIQLPPPPEMKTLVYVLMKKPEMNDILKLTQRPNPKPQKPEVFFIRYKNSSQQERKQPQSQQQIRNSTPQNGIMEQNFGKFESSDSPAGEYDQDVNEPDNTLAASPYQPQEDLPQFTFTPTAQYGIPV